jgi:hypothetical protein
VFDLRLHCAVMFLFDDKIGLDAADATLTLAMLLW